MKKLLSSILVFAMVISLCPAMLANADGTDLYARQIEKIPYYSNGQMVWNITEFGQTFTFKGESNYDASGTTRMKRLTASNQDEIWRLMGEPEYLFTGWSAGGTKEKLDNGEIYSQLDLGDATPIDEVQVTYLPAANIKNGQNYSIGKIPKIYRFETSNDGIVYTPVKTVITDLSEYKDTITTKEEYIEALGNNPELYDLMYAHSVVFDNTLNCRYLRFVMVQPTQDWLWNEGNGDRETTITNYQLFTYNTWKDDENASATSIAVKDSNGIYQFSNNGSDRNIIGFTGEAGLSSKAASRVTYKDETIGRDWNLDEGTLQSSWGGFALTTGDYTNYTKENVYLQYDFGYPERIDAIEQSFRNTEDATKVNDIPKTIRIDYGNKNSRGLTEWTKGEVFTFDMSDPLSVGTEKALAYNNFLANGTSTKKEKLFLAQSTTLELAQPVIARFMRIVYLQPTQNGSLPSENKLKIKKTIITDLEGLAMPNNLASGAQVPFNPDGSIAFVNVTDDNIRYSGETNADYPVSRLKASPYINWKDWYYRHLIYRNNNSWTGLQATPANFTNGKIYLELDFGKEIDVDSFLVDFKTYRSADEAGKYAAKAEHYNSIPSRVRIDYGIVDDTNKIKWTEGKTFDYTLDSYSLLSQYTKNDLVAAYNTTEGDRTTEQIAMVEAVNAIPTEATYDLGYKNARLLRYVILDPVQSGIENNSTSLYTWYLYSTTVYGANVQTPVTSATISNATVNSISYAITLAEEDKDAVIFAALYDGDYLVGVQRITANSISATFPSTAADNAKIFIWDNLLSIKPLSLAEFPIN
ncbi:MAG: hypothetical protein PHE51_05785 [Eubacteriales bacterium]|nr:hypothetical protein [Eubacteriales bacterium]